MKTQPLTAQKLKHARCYRDLIWFNKGKDTSFLTAPAGTGGFTVFYVTYNW